MSKLGLIENFNEEYIEINTLVGHLINNNVPSILKVKPIYHGIETKLLNSSLIEKDNKNYMINSFSVLHRVIDDLVDLDTELIDELTLADLNWIVYNSRILTHGVDMDVILTCPECKRKYDSREGTDSEIEQMKLLGEDYYKHDFTIKLDQYEFTNEFEETPTEEYKLNNKISLLIEPAKVKHYKIFRDFVLDDRKFNQTLDKMIDGDFKHLDAEYAKAEYEKFLHVSMFIKQITQNGKAIYDRDEANKDIFLELPLTLMSILKHGQFDEILELTQNVHSDIINKSTFKCPKDGYTKELEFFDYPSEYFFRTNVRQGKT